MPTVCELKIELKNRVIFNWKTSNEDCIKKGLKVANWENYSNFFQFSNGHLQQKVEYYHNKL